MKRKREKILKKSMRDRKRYLLLGKASKQNVERAILDYVGLLGWGKAAPFWVKNDILAVNRGELNKVKAGLGLAGINVKRVSGTLKGLKK